MAKRKRWRDPFADYIEWTEHRYDPGYYLGGRIPPHLKKASLGPKGRRNGGILLILSGILGAGEVVVYAEDWGGAFIGAIWPTLLLAAGTVMLLSSKTKTASKTSRTQTTRDPE
jgi:hypothetical protein